MDRLVPKMKLPAAQIGALGQGAFLLLAVSTAAR